MSFVFSGKCNIISLSLMRSYYIYGKISWKMKRIFAIMKKCLSLRADIGLRNVKNHWKTIN